MGNKNFDPNVAFSNDKFYRMFVARLQKIKTKLYGTLKFKPMFRNPGEMDIDVGSMHVTEVDLKKFSELMVNINKKYKTEITYCIYQTNQFPGDMMINFRTPAAPKMLKPNIRFTAEQMKKAQVK